MTKATPLYIITVIAVERMHSIVFPLRHKVLLNRVYKIALMLIWTIAGATTAAVTTAALYKSIAVLVISSGLPLIVDFLVNSITVSCYANLWISFRRRNRSKSDISSQPRQSFSCYPFDGFIITWFPTAFAPIACASKWCIIPNDTDIILECGILLALQSLIYLAIYCFRGF